MRIKKRSYRVEVTEQQGAVFDQYCAQEGVTKASVMRQFIESLAFKLKKN